MALIRSVLKKALFLHRRTSVALGGGSVSRLSASAVMEKLSDSLTPELCEKVLATAEDHSGSPTAKRFKLKVIANDLDWLEKEGYPLPQQLPEKTWNHLVSFEQRMTRFKYLEAILSGEMEMSEKEGSLESPLLKELRQFDRDLSGPLMVTKEMEENVCGNDEEKLEKLHRIKYEFEFMRQAGEQVYPMIELPELHDLIGTSSRKKIVSIFRYMRMRQDAKLKEVLKKRIKIEEGRKKKEEFEKKLQENFHIFYGLGFNTISMRVPENVLDKPDDYKVIREFHDWGTPLVFDLSFFKFMSFQQVKSLIYREMAFALKFNRESQEPFAPYFVSFDPNCERCKLMVKGLRRLMEKDYPAIVTEKSYLDLFPKERLVYLSPDSKTDLMENDPDNIYIIGALVDASKKTPFTLTQAKKQGIRHARFPMKRIIGLSPDLNVDHAVGVINDFKTTGDWFYSLRWVPPRFFKNRLKGNGGYTPEMEAMYIAQKKLTPLELQGEGGKTKMSPKRYRERFREVMEEHMPADRELRKALIMDGKYNHETRMEREKKAYGFLELT